MRWYIIRQWSIGGLMLLGLTNAVGVEPFERERLGGIVAREEACERKLQRYQKGWGRLIPQYQKIQYAGSMGLLSLGIGWDYGKKSQWETDLFLGYLPRFDGDRGYFTMTLKENYIPWNVAMKEERLKFDPFTASIYVNKIFGDDFWRREPDKYPNGYYGLATNLRFHLAFGQRLQFKIKPIGLAQKLTLFYEFSTSDLYIISYFTNKFLRFSDIFHFSLGIKWQFI